MTARFLNFTVKGYLFPLSILAPHHPSLRHAFQHNLTEAVSLRCDFKALAKQSQHFGWYFCVVMDETRSA